MSDLAARDAIAQDVHRRVLAVAGAGSGKTTQLVARVANTIAAGIPARQVAVITFTDKAARELVHRLRERGAAGIDDAFIGTIHGFCASVLRRFPIEAGLPPRFTTADEITSQADAARRRRLVIDEVYDAAAERPELMGALQIVATMVGLARLSAVVDTIDHQWHRFEATSTSRTTITDLWSAADEFLLAFDAFAGSKDNATLATARALIAPLRERPLAVADVAPLVLKLGSVGAKPERDDVLASFNRVVRLSHSLVLDEVVDAFRRPVVREAHARIANGALGYDDLLILTERVLRTRPDVLADARRRYQRIFVDEFQDTDRVQFEIIRMLSDPEPGESPAASPRLFAVGDPKQSIYAFRHADVELFAGLAAQGAADGSLAELTANFRTRGNVAAWINTVMAERFRAPALSAKALGERIKNDAWPPRITVPYEPLEATRPDSAPDAHDPGPAVVLLGVTEDGTPAVHTTAELAQQAEANDVVGLVQRIVDEGWRVLRPDEHDEHGRPLTWRSRPAELGDIAVLVAKRTGLAVLESAMRQAGVAFRIEGGTLAYESREVYELLRVLRAVENPADELLVVTALRTSVLGCSDADLFVHRHRHPSGMRGWWRLPSRAEPIAPPHPTDSSDDAAALRVRAALSQLAGWSAAAHQRGPAALLAEIYDWSMGIAAATFDGSNARAETWRRVRYLIDEARAFTDETGGTLRDYLGWVADKVETVERSEIAPDETDEQSVRVLTMHAAKGLEFPIVVVAALGTKDNVQADPFTAAWVTGSDARAAERATYRLGRLRGADYPDRDDEAQWAEEARLLYVATTRARDHLAISCHTSARSSPNAAQRITPHFDLATAERWRAPEATATEATEPPDVLGTGDAAPIGAAELPQRPPADRRAIWTPSALAAAQHDEPTFTDGAPRELDELLDGNDDDAGDDGIELGPHVAVDGIDPDPGDAGLAKDPLAGLEQTRSRGRYGTDVGTAVHEVLQLVRLEDPTTGLDELVAAACDNVDLVGPARRRVAELAASIIASPLFERMRSAAMCEREVYVGTVVGTAGEQLTVWGYVDAVFQADDGSLVVVDFKTDSSAAGDAELLRRYATQLNSYGVAVRQATGVPVSERWLLVGRAGGAARSVLVPEADPVWPHPNGTPTG